jgi:hypothetical protein
MATPFDASGKDLVELDPAAWLAFLGRPRPAELVSVIDADLSGTVSTATDKVVRVDDPQPWLAMIELQANWDGDLPFDVMRRYALVRHRHRLPTASVVVLLRPSANTSALTGTFEQPDPLGRDWGFPVHVVRVWQRDPETFLNGPLSLVPLAPIAAVDPGTVEGVLSEVEVRIRRDAPRSQAETLLEATFQLMALRFEDDFIEEMRQRMSKLDISQTPLVKAIRQDAAAEATAETKVREARKTILRQGGKKFGMPPPPSATTALNTITDLDRLYALSDRVLDVSTWDELLAGP